MKWRPAVGAAAERSSRGEDRLVELGVGDRLGDVGRQRHLPDAVNDVEEAPLPRAERELDEPAAALVDLLDHQAGHGAVREHDVRAGLEPATRLDQALPRVLVALAQQEHLDRAAGLVLEAEKPRGKHSRVVDDQHVAFAQVLRQVREGAMVDLSARALEHQQAAGVARLGRLLGDEPGGKVVVEVVGQHGAWRLLERLGSGRTRV